MELQSCSGPGLPHTASLWNETGLVYCSILLPPSGEGPQRKMVAWVKEQSSGTGGLLLSHKLMSWRHQASSFITFCGNGPHYGAYHTRYSFFNSSCNIKWTLVKKFCQCLWFMLWFDLMILTCDLLSLCPAIQKIGWSCKRGPSPVYILTWSAGSPPQPGEERPLNHLQSVCSYCQSSIEDNCLFQILRACDLPSIEKEVMFHFRLGGWGDSTRNALTLM